MIKRKLLVETYSYFRCIESTAEFYGVKMDKVSNAISEDRSRLKMDSTAYEQHLAEHVAPKITRKKRARLKKFAAQTRKPRVGDTIQEGGKTLQIVEVLDDRNVVVSPIHHGKVMTRIRRCLELTP